ncbi:cobalamin-binding protein [Sphingobacteriales bacterium UPWRP_1]|nr:cobalamin-binding protein [Sphingobacteriales bacterium TSM_CSM]PSJ74158.1 cobalamin-binding protein [Sphingobacteriales bacterium UPWRP_1]
MHGVFTDQMNRQVFIAQPLQRIVSLVPSQTELLYDLGLNEEVVGITKFCIHPQQWFRSKTRVGGTKDFSVQKIVGLNPGLVIGNKEENTRQGIEELEKKLPVWMSDVQNLPDALAMIQQIGQLCGKTDTALQISRQIQQRFNQIPKAQGQRVLYLIWRNPFMAAGHNTFIHDMLTRVCGFTNALPHNAGRYPQIDAGLLRELQPQVVMLSSEPYPFKPAHFAEIQEILPHAQVLPVNGEFFSWYGSRLLQAAAYFKELANRLYME